MGIQSATYNQVQKIKKMTGQDGVQQGNGTLEFYSTWEWGMKSKQTLGRQSRQQVK